jgi:hypothetical protein
LCKHQLGDVIVADVTPEIVEQIVAELGIWQRTDKLFWVVYLLIISDDR